MTASMIQISPALSIPMDIVTERTGILGVSGSGKTTTASSFAEELLKKHQPVVIIDPTDAWYGLRSSKDGKSAGYPITILGGDHGDIPLEETSGRLIAELVAGEAPSLVLSISHFSKSAMRRFMADFAERLFEKNRNALALIMDEADELAPQKIERGGERLYGAIDTIVRRGRVRGIGTTMITQRSAELSKSILSQCSTLIAHRASHPRDLAPIIAWMSVHAGPAQLEEVHSTIAKLKNGEAWVMSPDFLKFFGRVQMRDRETFNSSATPKVGERRVEPKHLAAVDLAALKARMAETIDRVSADDPKTLRARIAVLEKERDATAIQLRRALERGDKVARPPERIEIPVVSSAQLESIGSISQRIGEQIAAFQFAVTALNNSIKTLPLAQAKGVLDVLPQGKRLAGHTAVVPRPIPPAAAVVGRAAFHAEREQLGNSGLRRMLIALAQRPQGLTYAQIGIRAGISARSGTFSTYLSKARGQGWIDGSGTVKITSKGVSVLGAYEPLPEGRALADHWLAELGNSGAARILRTLLEVYPASLDSERVGLESDISHRSGTFSTYLSKLRSLELITGRAGDLRAADELVDGL